MGFLRTLAAFLGSVRLPLPRFVRRLLPQSGADGLDPSIYGYILRYSLRDQIYLVINAFATQMSDAKRIEIINSAELAMQQNWSDLSQFNNQNKVLSLQRAADKGEVNIIKKLYGIQ